MTLIRKTLVALTMIVLAAAAHAASWQYGMFTELSADANYAWQDGERRITGNDFAVFVDELANAGVIASGSKPKTFMAFFDQLGAQGWELVTVQHQPRGSVVMVHRYFKRPSSR